MQLALIQGVIAKSNINIPSNIFNWGRTSWGVDSIIFTLNIITGILSSITMTLPIAKFLSFSKFIELEIEDKAVRIGEPIRNVIIKRSNLSISTFRIKQAIGITIKKGSWKKSQFVIILMITTNSKDNPLI